MTNPSFDSHRLDELMEAAGIDWVVATSDHNAQYMLGNYRFFLHERSKAIGLSRYLPLVGYPKGQPQRAFYVACANESWQLEHQPLWLECIETAAVSSVATAAKAAAVIRESTASQRIGIEPSFLPFDAGEALHRDLPGAEFVDATDILETLRSIKMPRELDLIRAASLAIVESMLHVFRTSRSGETKEEVTSRYIQEVTTRGLTFEYALMTVGHSLNRAPYGDRWEKDQLLSLDSGGRLDGYIGDLCRMAVKGQPTSQMVEALDVVAAVQSAARGAISAGNVGDEIYEAAAKVMGKSPHRRNMRFVAHGMGLITHEAPRLADGGGGAPYPPSHRNQRLEAGMVLSVETQIANHDVGFVKLEDTFIVTDDGCEAPGDTGRGWNIVGAE